VGVSFDEPADNKAFAEQNDFPYRLLSDTTREMGLAYGACKDKSAGYPDRITYVIDAEGVIEWAAKVSDIDAHVEEAVKRLAGG
jgi:peroxiredoxin